MINCCEVHGEAYIFCGVLKSVKTQSFQFQGFASPEEKHAMRKEFNKRYLFKSYQEKGSLLIAKMAEKGVLDCLDKKLVREAKDGKIPSTMNFHHSILISWRGSSNNESNLVLMDKAFHDSLHAFIYDPLVEKIKEYEEKIATGETKVKKINIVLPVFPKVVTGMDMMHIFTPRECRQFCQFHNYMHEQNGQDKESLVEQVVVARKKEKARIVTHHSTARGCRKHMKKQKTVSR